MKLLDMSKILLRPREKNSLHRCFKGAVFFAFFSYSKESHLLTVMFIDSVVFIV